MNNDRTTYILATATGPVHVHVHIACSVSSSMQCTSCVALFDVLISCFEVITDARLPHAALLTRCGCLI